MNIQNLVLPRLQNIPQPRDIVEYPDGYIDFSFGNPSPLTFPVEEIEIAVKSSLSQNKLQYCADRGSDNLIVSLSRWLNKWGDSSPAAENLIITNGSMDGIALIADTFIGSGDIVLTESPTYWKAREIFQNAGAQVLYIPVEKDGLAIDELKKAIGECERIGKTCKLLYVIPNHQNPTGCMTSLEKRKEIVSICHEHNILIVEDDVYSQLTYEGKVPSSLYSLSDGTSVLQVGSLSKLIAPGIRIGWVIGSNSATDFILKVKRDGGTNPFASEVSAFLLDNLDWKERINYLRNFYHVRLITMHDNLEKIPKDILSWEKPDGGFYFWAKVSPDIVFEQLEKRATELGVGFMPGYLCTNDDKIGHDHIRLSFSNLDPAQVALGVDKLHNALVRARE